MRGPIVVRYIILKTVLFLTTGFCVISINFIWIWIYLFCNPRDQPNFLSMIQCSKYYDQTHFFIYHTITNLVLLYFTKRPKLFFCFVGIPTILHNSFVSIKSRSLAAWICSKSWDFLYFWGSHLAIQLWGVFKLPQQLYLKFGFSFNELL